MPRPSRKLTKTDLDTLRRRTELEAELAAADAGSADAERIGQALEKLPMKPADRRELEAALEKAEAAGDAREVTRLRKALRRPVLGEILADAGQPGLYAAARGGQVRFYMRYRPPGGGRRRTLHIDTYGAITLAMARDVAQGHRYRVAQRVDPAEELAEQKRDSATVADCVAGYIKDLERAVALGDKKRSSLGSARDRLTRHVLPKLGDRRVRDVTPADVRRWHLEIPTPAEANRALSALSPVFSWARGEGLIAENPCSRDRDVKPFKEHGRRRDLTPKELERLGAVLHEAESTGGVEIQLEGRKEARRYTIHPSLVRAVRLLALTGFRSAEVLGHGARERRGKREGLRWGDVDLDAGAIHLRDSKTGRQTRTVGRAALELLRAARPADAGADDPVCPGELPGAPLVGTGRPRRYLWEAAGIAETAAGNADLHSLRHSYASIGAHLQDGRFSGLVGQLLGHASQARAVTARYVHEDRAALKRAADAIAGEIARLLGLSEPGEVVEFPRKATASGG